MRTFLQTIHLKVVLWSHIETLTQFTGRARPPAGTCTLSVGLVAGGSILTQAALLTVCSIKTCRAFCETNTQIKPSSDPLIYPSYRWLLFSVLCSLTFCAVGSGPAWHADTPSTGRVADAIVTAATGSVTSFSIGTCRASCQEGDKQYRYLFMNSADQKWKFQWLVSDTWGTSSWCFLMCDWAGVSRITLKPSVFLFHCVSALKRCSWCCYTNVQIQTSEPLIPPFLHNKKGHQTLWALWTLCLAPVTHLGCRRARSSRRYRSKLRWQHHSSHHSDTNTFPGSPAQRNPEDTLEHT